MHLAGKTDASDFVCARAGLSQRLRHGDAKGPPPIFRPLLGPADLRRSERLVLFGGRSDDFAALADEQGARAGRADIDSQEKDRRLRACTITASKY